MTKNNIDASAVSEGEVTANALLEALGTTLEPDLLVEALTHRSFSHENPGAKNYERLEFLVNAVLNERCTDQRFDDIAQNRAFIGAALIAFAMTEQNVRARM